MIRELDLVASKVEKMVVGIVVVFASVFLATVVPPILTFLLSLILIGVWAWWTNTMDYETNNNFGVALKSVMYTSLVLSLAMLVFVIIGGVNIFIGTKFGQYNLIVEPSVLSFIVGRY